MKRLLILFLSLAPVFIFSQTDEINISAAFTTSLSLQVTGNPNVEWVVATIDDYKEGFFPRERKVPFQVSASVNYSVEIAMNALTDAAGNTLDIENIGFRVEPNGNAIKDEHGSRYVWTKGNSASLSGIYVASSTSQVLIEPGPAGNAGGYDENMFKLRIGLNSSNIRAITGLPQLTGPKYYSRHLY